MINIFTTHSRIIMSHKIIVNFVFLVKFYTTKLKLTKKMMILLALTHECSYIFGRTWYDDVRGPPFMDGPLFLD